MQKINKKAVSDIAATVTILVLTLVLVSLAWTIISKNLGTAQLAPAMSCLEMQTSYPLSIQKACYNSETNKTEATLKRAFDLEISAFDFVITTPTETYKWFAGPTCESCEVLSKGQTKTYYLNQTLNANQNNQLVILINNCQIQTKDITSC